MSPLQQRIEQARQKVLALIEADPPATHKEEAVEAVNLIADILIHVTEPRA